MSVPSWCRRLHRDLPGWQVWCAGAGWYAVPVRARTDPAVVAGLPGRVGPFGTPQELRRMCRRPYARLHTDR